jgi:hypothetical protein
MSSASKCEPRSKGEFGQYSEDGMSRRVTFRQFMGPRPATCKGFRTGSTLDFSEVRLQDPA